MVPRSSPVSTGCPAGDLRRFGPCSAADLRAVARGVLLLVAPVLAGVPAGRPSRPWDRCRALGLPVLAAWDALRPLVARDGSEPWFEPSEGNPHLGIAGHERYAAWLHQQLPALLFPDSP